MKKAILSSSEFWMAVAALIAKALELGNILPQQDFNMFIVPAVTYIVGRLTSKVAKSAAKGASSA